MKKQYNQFLPISIRYVENGMRKEYKPTWLDVFFIKINIVSKNLKRFAKEHIHHDGTTLATIELLKKIHKIQSKKSNK